MKKQHRKIYRSKSSAILCPFEHHYACWANNHNGWSKAKAFEKRYAKRRMRQNQRDEIQQELEDMDNDD